VAIKKNKATVDNHQNVELITKLLSENISRQTRWASQPRAAHSPNACTKVSSPQVTKTSIKASQRVKFARPRTQPTKNNTTTPAHQHTKNTTTVKTTSPSLNHHHTINPAHELSNREDLHHQHTIRSTKPSKPKTNMVT
jgi:hypothetical protein